LSTKENRKA